MPKQLEKCVKDIQKEGKSESEAYAICAKSTGWVRKSGGGWINKKTGEVFNENFEKSYITFTKLFFESNQSTLKWLQDNKNIISEIKRLKSLIGTVPPNEEQSLLGLIKWLESKIRK